MKSGPWILLGIGIFTAVVFGLLAMVTLILMVTSNGKIDGEEAGPFIGLGCCCSSVGGLLAVGGLIWLLTSPKR
jgi:hypothetical protein